MSSIVVHLSDEDVPTVLSIQREKYPQYAYTIPKWVHERTTLLRLCGVRGEYIEGLRGTMLNRTYMTLKLTSSESRSINKQYSWG